MAHLMPGSIARSPRARRLVALGLGAAVAGATVLAVGGGSFLRGIGSIGAASIGAALLFALVATAAAAWRWSVVARGLGVPLAWHRAVIAYYRSQFLNTVLPGGVLGDVHRAYRHGRDAGGAVVAARAVATERIAGQLVQLVIVIAVLTALGATAPIPGIAGIAGAVALLVAVALGVVALTPRGRRLAVRELTALRRVFASPLRTLAVIASSALVVACHAATFVVACLGTGIAATPRELIVLALVALCAASVPVNLGGWGPREAASASAFALVGLGAGAGLAASAAFGVLTMIAVAPGAVALVVDRVRAGRSATRAAATRRGVTATTRPPTPNPTPTELIA